MRKFYDPGSGGKWGYAPAILMSLFLILPVAAIFGKTLSGMAWMPFLSSTRVRESLYLSFKTSSICLGLVLLFGTPMAFLLSRRRFRGARVIETLLDLPMVLPPAVAGLGLLIAFGRRGWIGQWLDSLGIEIAFTQAAVVLAQVFVATPFYIRAAKAGFVSIDRELEQVAYTLGFSRFQTFLHVTVPLVLPAITAGSVMAWARALGEFGATIMFAGNLPGRTQTVPLAIYQSMETGLDEPVILSAVLILVSFAVLMTFRIASEWNQDS
ncbi:MAG: ABC transporter permease [Candidatus Omnitrophica bacterium]|nr:molybdate ABC transporter permease subunit [bacterium]MBV6483080.1 hypothetical protein [bacterium]MBW7938736.1 molybdate ABC transporter permease subunit [Candidatus Omnitrophota bacterium]MCE7909865.1 molybdate ABC transporter permease subunit [Candidatus Omnitrophica bacterium COP1]MCL4736543.1 ABC transporter permease [Candidatus Omnitrophota bacterium]